MTYDPKCADLARVFLADDGLDSAEHVHALAQDIQAAIEDYIAMLDKRAHGTVMGE